MRNWVKKIKNQKGATGTDVLLAASMIVIAIGIVSMLYVNTSLQSRNITRTAGATRIATNLVENIDALTYNEFLAKFSTYLTKFPVEDTLNPGTNLENVFAVVGTNTPAVAGDNEIYGTKIPSGFTAEITAEEIFGSHTATSEQFDLVREVNIVVKYDVGKVEERVDFKVVKQRELIEECNAPAIGDLRNGFVEDGINYYPVKYLQNANAYIKTTEDDNEWYNYSNKEWATIIVSKKAESDLFDPNGKFIGTINTTKSSADYTQKVVWIPKYFTKTGDKSVQFTFNSSNNQGRVNDFLIAKDTTTKFTYKTFKDVLADGWVETGYFSDGTAGKWTLVESSNAFPNMDFIKKLNESQYGPCNMH